MHHTHKKNDAMWNDMFCSTKNSMISISIKYIKWVPYEHKRYVSRHILRFPFRKYTILDSLGKAELLRP